MTHAYSMYLFFSQSESMKLKVSRYYQYSNVVGENQGSSLSSHPKPRNLCVKHIEEGVAKNTCLLHTDVKVGNWAIGKKGNTYWDMWC